ncbi:MAG: hypothetical protein ACI9HK_005617 [Pirellulaceae bacterium]
MLTRLLIVAFLTFGLTSQLVAQEWATKMFKITKHDFGTVARGSTATFEFSYENIYEEEFHISAVRSSCGCTTPKIKNSSLKTWEKGAIIADFNTQVFLGYKSATITVVIDKPFAAEVQLEVVGNIRGDIAINPGLVDFGAARQGSRVERAVNISHVGSDGWQIVDVRAESGIYEVELEEKLRRKGKTEYEMRVRLKASAPAGYLQDQLTIVTNDVDNKTISIPIGGIIQSPITIDPGSLTMGVVPVNHSVTKYLIVRAKMPFRITKVSCDDGCFDVQPSPESKTLHRVPVVFTADDKPRRIVQSIMFETDLAEGASAKCLATVTVQ